MFSHKHQNHLPWLKPGLPRKSIFLCSKKRKMVVEQHSVVCLLRGVQKLPTETLSWAPTLRMKRRAPQNLLLGQKNLHDLIISGGEPLKYTNKHMWITPDQEQQAQWSFSHLHSRRFLLPSACPERAGEQVDMCSPETAADRPRTSRSSYWSKASWGFADRGMYINDRSSLRHWVRLNCKLTSGLGVAQDVILKKLVQHVEEVVLDQSFDD